MLLVAPGLTTRSKKLLEDIADAVSNPRAAKQRNPLGALSPTWASQDGSLQAVVVPQETGGNSEKHVRMLIPFCHERTWRCQHMPTKRRLNTG